MNTNDLSTGGASPLHPSIRQLLSEWCFAARARGLDPGQLLSDAEVTRISVLLEAEAALLTQVDKILSNKGF